MKQLTFVIWNGEPKRSSIKHDGVYDEPRSGKRSIIILSSSDLEW
jgi:hypothetical protein